MKFQLDKLRVCSSVKSAQLLKQKAHPCTWATPSVACGAEAVRACGEEAKPGAQNWEISVLEETLAGVVFLLKSHFCLFSHQFQLEMGSLKSQALHSRVRAEEILLISRYQLSSGGSTK